MDSPYLVLPLLMLYASLGIQWSLEVGLKKAAVQFTNFWRFLLSEKSVSDQKTFELHLKENHPMEFAHLNLS